MTQLFGRAALLEVGPSNASGLQVDSRNDEGFRIGFDVVKTIQSETNKATVQVYNLSPSSRLRIAKGHTLMLLAGYAETMELIYEGEVAAVETARQGANYVTTIECGDGTEAFDSQDYKHTFPSGTPVRTVILKVAEQFKSAMPDDTTAPVLFGNRPKPTKASRLSLRNLKRDLDVLETTLKEQGFSTVLRRQMSVAGNAKDVMNSLASMYRFDWSVQDGTFQIVAYGQAIVGEATYLTEDTGLIGIPSLTEKGCKLTALIQPKIRPGALITVESAAVEGLFRVEYAHFTGDTHGGQWLVEVEASAL
ncbi:MAG: hypothetical protein V2A73_16080 [Pseudomonadota bacterium]